MLKLSADATPFTFETAGATQKGAGMTPFTISGKRQAYADYERGQLVAEVAALKADLKVLNAMAGRTPWHPAAARHVIHNVTYRFVYALYVELLHVAQHALGPNA